MTVKLDRIPKDLQALAQFVYWKYIGDDRRKVPFGADGRPASTTNPETWLSFADVSNYAEQGYDGVGFVFADTDPYCGIDLDGCRDPETGKVADWAREWIIRFASYSEVSPSKTGVKVFVRGKSPLPCGKKRQVDAEPIGGKTAAVEVYDHARYFCLTGMKLQGMPDTVESRQDALDEFCRTFWPPEQPQPAPQYAPSDGNVVDRAAKYVAKLPEAVSGQGGHDRTFHAACVLVCGFGLSPDEAYPVLCEYNQRCNPPWSEKDLHHKLDDAAKQPGPRNYLRDARPEQWDRVKVPQYKAPPAPKPAITLQDAAQQYLDRLARGDVTLYELGIGDTDYAIGGGVEPGEMVLLCGLPSHCKSALAMQIVDTMTRNGLPSLIISEEMSALAIGKRAVTFISDRNQESWKQSVDEVRAELDWHFKDRAPAYLVNSVQTAAMAAAEIRHHVRENGVKFAVVDYAQLLTAEGRNRYEQVTATSIMLRQAANENGITVLALCQLNSEIEKRDKFIPRLGDVADSRQLTKDADVVLFLCWPLKLDPKHKPHDEFFVFVGKNRNRPINQFTVRARFVAGRQMVLPPKAHEEQPAEHWSDAYK